MFGDPETPGRRLEIKHDEEGKPNLNLCLPEQPGDYVGPIYGYTGSVEAVFYVLPKREDEPGFGKVGHVTSPPHEFIENEDGSLTINPSILSADGWHGYLTEGRWKRV